MINKDTEKRFIFEEHGAIIDSLNKDIKYENKPLYVQCTTDYLKGSKPISTIL